MADLELRRGDRKTIAISDLVDGDGASAAFTDEDILRWTAKRYVGQPDSAALFTKTSEDGGIIVDVGSDTATIVITATDWDALPVSNDLRFAWDLQLALAGDEDQIVTIASGEGLIRSDVSVASGAPVIVTVGEFAEFIRLPVDTIDQDAAAAVLSGASHLVREELGQALDYVADDVVTLKSPGGKLLLLPELPVIDVTLVRIRRPGGEWTELVAGTDYEVELGRAGKIWRIGSGAIGFFGETSSEWPRTNGGRGLNGFVEVTNSHGYDLTGGADYSDAEPVPELLKTVIKRVAARGYQNPEAVSQETTGRGTVVYGQGLGLYLSNDDKRDLDSFRPGGAGGSR